MPVQTDEQRSAALNAAGLDATQQAGVTSGAGYALVAPRTITSTTDPNVDAATSYLNTFKAPESADQIAERMRKDSAGLIDSINGDYQSRVANAQKAGQERVNQNDSVSVLSGLMGSTEAARTRNVVSDANQKEIDAINNQKALAVAQVYSKIKGDAETEARAQLQDATKSAEDIVARRKQVSEDAVNNLKQMATSGLVDFDALKNNPANKLVFDHALDAVGGSEDALRGIFMASRPQDQLIGTPQRVGDHFIQAYKNPITGKVSYDTLQVPGLGTEYSSFQKMGDNLVAIPDNWDGDVTKLKTIVGQPSQQDLLDQQYKQLQIQGVGLDNAKKSADLAGGGSGASGGSAPDQLYDGLSAHTSTAVRARVNKYASDNTIQNFSTVQDGYNFATSLNSNTKNPADDQALIYSLAKALEPGSVVREGEYATAQKYAQSWVAAYGKGVSQALLGTGFLSKTARDNIKTTITEKYNSQKRSYDQTRKSYIEGLNALTGRSDGEKFITEYQTPDQNASISVTDPAGGVHSFPDQKSADAFKKAAGL